MQTRTLIKVRGYHLDLYGHVNNARYLEFLEEARWDYLEQQLDLSAFTGSGRGFAVVNINISYRRGAYVNETLEVVTSLARLRKKSAVMQQKVFLQGTETLIADAEVTFVVVDQKQQKAVPLDGELRRLLEQWQAPAPVITLDGPSGSGKGTVAGLLAKRLGWQLLDSGALYRLVGLAAEQEGVSLQNEAGLSSLAKNLDARFHVTDDELVQVFLAGKEVSQTLRSEKAGALASQVAPLPGVRQALLTRQRAFAQSPGLICDGRDMGTVVFPEAPLKIYLTASADERAKRRFEQLRAKGIAASLADLKKDILARDARDMNRETAPLRPAEDAVQVDSTLLSITEVVDLILAKAKSRGLILQASSA